MAYQPWLQAEVIVVGKSRNQRTLRMSILASVVIVVSVASYLTVSLAGGGLSVVGYSVAGQTVDVQVNNPTRSPMNCLVTATANIGGTRETGYSFAQSVPSGQTVTFTIYFSGPVAGITEGPDPIPQ